MRFVNIGFGVSIETNCDCICREKICSIKKEEFTGKQCKLTEPIYNVTFDLNSLKSDVGHRVAGDNGDDLKFNLCGNFPKKCANIDALACFTRNGVEYPIGNELISILSQTEFAKISA